MSEAKDKLELQGILSGGYGIVPKNVMKDKKLTIEAKAIYSYLCSYAGAGNTAFPSVELICDNLGISQARFNKHRKLLEQAGYIHIKRNRQESGFSNNIYTLVQFVTPQNVGIGNVLVGNVLIGNEGTNNNTLNNNTLNNNNTKRDSRNSAKAKYADDSPYLKLAELLFERIKTRNPKHKKPNLQSWADDVRKTIELDERSKDDYLNVLEWSQSDLFWQDNILSPAKLRKQFDTLMVQMQSNRNKSYGYKKEVVPQQTKIHKHVIDDEDREAFERLQREGF